MSAAPLLPCPFCGSADIRIDRVLFDCLPCPDAHFATFPPLLAETCILAGTSAAGCCSACGAPQVRIVKKGAADLAHQRACGGDANGEYDGEATKDYASACAQNGSAVKSRILAGMKLRTMAAWRPTCTCEGAHLVPCRVLDPFLGSGTTALVADRLQRDCLGIELNPDYAAMARRRLQDDAGMLLNHAASAPETQEQQRCMF